MIVRAGVEVAGQELAGVLGVAALGGGREADEVGEEDGDEPALGNRLLLSASPGESRRCESVDRSALGAELRAGRKGRGARRARPGECRPALGAELRADRVLCPTGSQFIVRL